MMYYDYIISGGGASGLMLAYRMAKDSFFDQKSILIIDSIENRKDNRTWSYWESGDGEWDDIVAKSWDQICFYNNDTKKVIPLKSFRYKTIMSNLFYDKVWEVIKAKSNIEFYKNEIIDLISFNGYTKVFTNERVFKADKVFNSIPNYINFTEQDKYPVLKQHFLGWFIKTEQPYFDDMSPIFMDFRIPQRGSTRFMYLLPFKNNEALIEFTLFSKELLSHEEYEQMIKHYLIKEGIKNFSIIKKEFGVIPMTAYPFSSHNTRNLIHIGTNGGWTKPSTGYTFKNTSKNTNLIIEFLKKDYDFKKFNKKNKFTFYDLLFLDVLNENNDCGAELFSKLFINCNIEILLKFLDDSTKFIDDFNIISSVPSKLFLKALLKRILN